MNTSLGWLLQSQNEAHKCGLATAIGTDDAKIIVLIDGQIDILEHLLSVVFCRYMLDLNDWF